MGWVDIHLGGIINLQRADAARVMELGKTSWSVFCWGMCIPARCNTVALVDQDEQAYF